MIEFELVRDCLLLSYDSQDRGNDWVYRKLKETGFVGLKNTFQFEKKHLYGASAKPGPDEEKPVKFKIGKVQDDYILIDREVLEVEFDLFIHYSVKLTYRSFTAEKNVSIFQHVNDLSPSEIRIGGDHPDAMPESEYRRLLKYFPNTYELKRYVGARVSSVLRDFFETKTDGEEKYHSYMKRKTPVGRDQLLDIFKEGEILKYQILLDRLTEMLANESKYSEAQWQAGILQILLLLYPKYIRVFKEAPVRDTYANKNRSIDFMLVDSSGNVDIVEIKQPFDKCIVTETQYRDNYIPLRDLSGTVMQIEKYIFYLSKWGRAGEDALTNKYKDELPSEFRIKITNPGGLIVMGRESNLTEEQRQDFEIIKRKYKNVMDIITYDDLLSRLRFTLEQLEKRV